MSTIFLSYYCRFGFCGVNCLFPLGIALLRDCKLAVGVKPERPDGLRSLDMTCFSHIAIPAPAEFLDGGNARYPEVPCFAPTAGLSRRGTASCQQTKNGEERQEESSKNCDWGAHD
jgi:hypothetical protein